MWLKVCARALTSSPPLSSARTSVRPSPTARAASSSDRRRLRAGRKIRSATIIEPAVEQAQAGPRQRRTELAQQHLNRRRSVRSGDQAHLRAADDDGREVHRTAGPAAAAARPPAPEVGWRTVAFSRWGSAGCLARLLRRPQPFTEPFAVTKTLAALGSTARFHGRRAPEALAESRRQHAGPVDGPAAVAHEHHEALGHVAVSLGDVSLQIEGRILGQRVGQLARHLIGELLRRAARGRQRKAAGQPEEQHALHEQQRGEHRDEAERDAPIQAAEPDGSRHRRTCSRIPTP